MSGEMAWNGTGHGPGCSTLAGVDEAAAIHAALFATDALFRSGSQKINAVGPEVKIGSKIDRSVHMLINTLSTAVRKGITETLETLNFICIMFSQHMLPMFAVSRDAGYFACGLPAVKLGSSEAHDASLKSEAALLQLFRTACGLFLPTHIQRNPL